MHLMHNIMYFYDLILSVEFFYIIDVYHHNNLNYNFFFFSNWVFNTDFWHYWKCICHLCREQCVQCLWGRVCSEQAREAIGERKVGIMLYYCCRCLVLINYYKWTANRIVQLRVGICDWERKGIIMLICSAIPNLWCLIIHLSVCIADLMCSILKKLPVGS